ncbi:MAG: geranylgeranyl reductase family protein [Acidimicrobiia bacterium]|nr:geranylgeranyl reductase family protein [Acidimicrobiia bacterium]
MNGRRYDALVVGAGPAGSIAALVLARGGASVALVDKASFPRDKACGDLVGPRGVQLLADLGIEVPGATHVDDMVVVGPTGRRVRLPCQEGETYPGHAIAMPRCRFDAVLHEAAVDAGAQPIAARVADPQFGRDGELEGFSIAGGSTVCADAVIGADGATSRVAEVAGLVEPRRVLWGFALRAYLDDPVTVPNIVFWEERPWRGFPGYGWLFPGVDGRANVGLGLGVLADRAAGARATRAFDAFAEDLGRAGVLTGRRDSMSSRLGGWLKMGMVGTTPARGRVLLSGDAAGLVNPLQGEGISQAMASGRAAAEALLAGPYRSAARYRKFLATTYVPYQSITAPIHGSLLPRAIAVAAVGRILTAPPVGRTVAGGWSIFWNDLLAGARPGSGRRLAATAATLGGLITGPGRTKRWFSRSVATEDSVGG